MHGNSIKPKPYELPLHSLPLNVLAISGHFGTSQFLSKMPIFPNKSLILRSKYLEHG